MRKDGVKIGGGRISFRFSCDPHDPAYTTGKGRIITFQHRDVHVMRDRAGSTADLPLCFPLRSFSTHFIVIHARAYECACAISVDSRCCGGHYAQVTHCSSSLCVLRALLRAGKIRRGLGATCSQNFIATAWVGGAGLYAFVRAGTTDTV